MNANGGDIVLTSDIVRSGRVQQLEGMFDLEPHTHSVVTIPRFPVERLDERDWNVGLIVGPSGSGKTQTARRAFAESWGVAHEWSSSRAVVDEMPDGVGTKEIVEVLSSVGLSSPPAWLRPFQVLSNGEQFRVDIARALLERRDITVVDEFTSVVDRTVAQVASHAVQRAVRKRKQRFVAVTCHYDVEDWLQPDWRYDPVTGDFAWRLLHPRPRIDLDIVRGDATDWPTFRAHHYLSQSFLKSSRVLMALIDGHPAAFLAVCPMPHGTIHNAWRIHRWVTLPDYQGVGVGAALLDRGSAGFVACGKRVYNTSSHPAAIVAMNNSPTWAMVRAKKRNPTAHTAQRTEFARSIRRTGAIDRATATFRYVGKPDWDVAALLAGGSLVPTARR